jgi:hypothetical protein
MSLTELMSAARLSFYTEVGMVIFLAVFVSVAVQLLRSKRSDWTHAENLPLDLEPEHPAD